MKTLNRTFVMLLSLIVMNSCAQEDKKETVKNTPIMQKEATLEMNKDSLDAKIIEEIAEQVIERKLKLTEEALSTTGETYAILEAIKKGEREDAIKKGKLLIGKLEVLLTREPNLSLIPINVNYQKNELVTTIDEVRKATKLAEEAMDNGYYQLAGKLLNDIKSEMIINTYFLPAGSYPDAIRIAVAMLEEDKTEEAKVVLNDVLGTIVIEKKIQPLPILNAEQMIIEAAIVDKENHENADKVLNLLNNAQYQLTLAEEMGYGKKDKDFRTLSESIKILKKSVKNKNNSNSKFDSLKQDIKKFKEKLLLKTKK